MIVAAATFGVEPVLDRLRDPGLELELLPLVIAFKPSLGQECRVSVEVAQVAKDIRATFEKYRSEGWLATVDNHP